MMAYAESVKMWKGFKLLTEADLEQHLDSFRIFFTYNSNMIENEKIVSEDAYEVFEHNRVVNYTGDTRTIVEFPKPEERLSLSLLKAFGERTPFDESFIIEMQRIIAKIDVYSSFQWSQASSIL